MPVDKGRTTGQPCLPSEAAGNVRCGTSGHTHSTSRPTASPVVDLTAAGPLAGTPRQEEHRAPLGRKTPWKQA